MFVSRKRVLSRGKVSLERIEWEDGGYLMRLLNRHFNQCVAGRRKLFLWRLHQLKWKLMIVIITASDQVTTNLVGRQRSHTTAEWYGNPVLEVMLLSNNEPTSYEESNGGPGFRQMAGSHEIRERIHV